METTTLRIVGTSQSYLAVQTATGNWHGLVGEHHFTAPPCSATELKRALPGSRSEVAISVPTVLVPTFGAGLRHLGGWEVEPSDLAADASCRVSSGGIVIHSSAACATCLNLWDADNGLCGLVESAEIGDAITALAAAALVRWVTDPLDDAHRCLLADHAGVRQALIFRHPHCLDCSPSEMGMLALTDMISPYGPVSWVSLSTAEDVTGLPVYHARIPVPQLESNQYQGGKGFTLDDALRSAIGECLERFEAYYWQFGVQWLTCPAGVERETVLTPQLFGLDGLEAEAVRWTEARELYGTRRFLVPAAAVGFSYAGSDASGCYSHSTGLAAGQTVNDAAERALLELIERDAYWMVLRHQLTMPDLTPDLCDDARSRALLHRLACSGIRAHFKLLDVGLQPPSVHCLLEADTYPVFTHGLACRWNVREAMMAALLEAVQLRIDQIRLHADPEGQDDSFVRWGDGDRAPEAAVFLSCGRRADMASIRSYHRDELLASLTRCGLGFPLFVDLSSNHLAVKVVRVLIPGFDALRQDALHVSRQFLTRPFQLGLTERPVEQVEDLAYQGTVCT